METLFPISYSTLSADALATFISANYPHGPFRCRFLLRGVGDTYLVESADAKFIFRVYRATHRDLPAIESETSLLVTLRDAGVSVSYPIADRNGQLIQAFQAAEGQRHGVLFSFAEGKVINSPDKEQLRSIGQEIARFHNISSVIQLNGVSRKFDLQTTLFEPLEKTRNCFVNDPDGYEWLWSAAKKIKTFFAEADTSAFSGGYCHFDFLPKNFHFDGSKVTLFDFDFLGYGWLVNDLMIFWQHLWLDVYFNRITKENAESSFKILIEAYREIRPVSDAELNAIPWLGLGFWLFYMQFHSTHDQFYPLIFEPSTLKMRTGLIRQLVERDWQRELLFIS